MPLSAGSLQSENNCLDCWAVNMKRPQFVKILRTISPATQHHIPATAASLSKHYLLKLQRPHKKKKNSEKSVKGFKHLLPQRADSYTYNTFSMQELLKLQVTHF